jgi:hypothetical protein
MKTDANKDINTNIVYNYLNLPTQVTLACGTINYIYDATGRKQRKMPQVLQPIMQVVFSTKTIYYSFSRNRKVMLVIATEFLNIFTHTKIIWAMFA